MPDISSLFPVLTAGERRSLLAMPSGRIRAVLDTDTFNEVDDQFALLYMLHSPEIFDLRAVCAAPFFNERSTGPADGMEKSRQEILRIFELTGRDPDGVVFSGSKSYLPDTLEPVKSPAASRIVEVAHEAGADGEVLYIFAIGAITNVASALLSAPEIIGSVVVVWLGGHALHTAHNNEFNLIQDVAAAQVIFDSGVPFFWVPCYGVAELLSITLPELEKRAAFCGKAGQFLYQRTADYLEHDPARQKIIWDIAPVTCFTVPEAVTSVITPAPILGSDRSWSERPDRHEIRRITHIRRTMTFDALFAALEK